MNIPQESTTLLLAAIKLGKPCPATTHNQVTQIPAWQRQLPASAHHTQGLRCLYGHLDINHRSTFSSHCLLQGAKPYACFHAPHKSIHSAPVGLHQPLIIRPLQLASPPPQPLHAAGMPQLPKDHNHMATRPGSSSYHRPSPQVLARVSCSAGADE